MRIVIPTPRQLLTLVLLLSVGSVTWLNHRYPGLPTTLAEALIAGSLVVASLGICLALG